MKEPWSVKLCIVNFCVYLTHSTHERFCCNRRSLTHARRASWRENRDARVSLVHLVYLVRPIERKKPEKQERPASLHASRVPMCHFVTTVMNNAGLGGCCLMGSRGTLAWLVYLVCLVDLVHLVCFVA